jgi:hypothetical protein
MKVEEGLFEKRRGTNLWEEGTREGKHGQSTVYTCMKYHEETH